MNTEMSELRKIFDLFEGAGFTVTYCLMPIEFFPLFETMPKEIKASSECFEIAIKSSSIKCAHKTLEEETAHASAIITLAENAGYQAVYFKKGDYINAYNYGGTILIHLIPITGRQ
jgi:hypothetical protein